MLWYKTWRETRTRLMIGAAALGWVCVAIVLTQKGNRAHAEPPLTYVAYIWKAVYKGYVRDFFTIIVIVLGGGGLLQERAHGTAGFTLALPVSRTRLMMTRAAVGLVEVALLAVVPAVVVCAFSPAMGEHYQLAQALQFSLLWTAGGAVVFGAAVLLSTVLAGEYSAWIACFLCMMLYSAAVNVTALQQFPRLNFFKIMSGADMPYFASASHLLTGPLPWAPLLAMAAVAMGLIALAGRFTQKRDY
jgi:ABC-2 type transport system permease protein